MFLRTFSVLAFVAYGLALPHGTTHIIHEKREIIEPGRGDRVPHDAIIPVRIGLKLGNLDNGYDKVMGVSDPASPNYGKHWTAEEVWEYFAPSDEAVAIVTKWLVDAEIEAESIGFSEDRAWVGVNIPVKQAEEMLDAEYYEHETHDGSIRIGCDEYSLPRHVSEHVDYIKPGVSLSPPLAKTTLTRRDLLDLVPDVVNTTDDTSSSTTTPSYGRPFSPFQSGPGSNPMPAGYAGYGSSLQFCDRLITPGCIRALYDIPRNTINDPPNTLGVAEFNGDAYSQTDLNLFFANLAPYVPQNTHPTLVSIDGGTAPAPPGQAGLESDIDFDMVYGLIYPQSVTLYEVANVNYNAFSDRQSLNEVTFLLPFLDAVDGSFCTSVDRRMGFQCGTASLTKVLSASWGNQELYIGQRAAIRTCNEIMKLTLQGTTFIFSSGDYGVAGFPGPNYNGCINKSLNFGVSGTIFSPDFPVDCPYVLGVGATQLNPGETVNDPEHVMDVPSLDQGGATFTSGGGFSNYFKRPQYQDAAVQKYLDHYAPNYPYYNYNGHDIFSGKTNIGQNGGIYNRIGRGFPDVSANGANFGAFINGLEYLTYGTSLACPLWASIITLINEERSKAGQPSVGFINPILYQHPEVFTDITLGSNPGCGTQGFPASPGWDPVTGLGTPVYPKLLQVFLNAGYGHYSS